MVTSAYVDFLTLLAARTLVVLVVLIIGFRIAGKRQLGQVNVYDLAMIMLVANGIQNAMTNGKGELAVGIVCAGTLLLAGKAVSYLFIHLPKFERSCVGMPTVLIRHGEIIKQNMRREGVSHDHLMLALRERGYLSHSEIELAVLEVDGSIGVVPRDEPGGAETAPPPDGNNATP
jgi:uncharacterized membrane protein YcaP (DUF421 family)